MGVIKMAKNLYVWKNQTMTPQTEHERELKRIYLEMKTGSFLDRFHPSLMNEWESFLFLFLTSRPGKTILNNFTISLWLSEVVMTLGYDFFSSGNIAPVFRISLILFTFGNSLYLLNTLGTQVFSKIREDFVKRKRDLLNIGLLPKLTLYGISSHMCLCYFKGLMPNISFFLMQIYATVVAVVSWTFSDKFKVVQ